MTSDNYYQTSPNIKTYADIISKKELEHSKFMHGHIFPRSVNITNHAITHKCSGYVFVDKEHPQIFDVLIHPNLSVDYQ